ncbi:MAG: hypothetical protein ACTSVY_15100 [Candidatus Helarchaeota archaeon]
MVIELAESNSKYMFGDIPDDFKTKYFLPLTPHIYNAYKEFGLDWIDPVFDKFDDVQYEVTQERFDVIIETGKKILSNEIPMTDAERTCLYGIPHIILNRADLIQGTTTLLYGESSDITFIVINDLSGNIQFIFNCHTESGVPVDWWLVNKDDELLDRRHLKLGLKMRNIPNKTKSLKKAASLMMSTLKDIRNERTPEWNNSFYTAACCYATTTFNMFAELSNYEVILSLYQGLAAKSFGLPDYLFLYYPDPPLIGSLVLGGQRKFVPVIAGLMTNNQLVFNQLEDFAIRFVIEEFPELYKFAFISQLIDKGVPLPKSTINLEFPNKVKDFINKDDLINRKYPKSNKIFIDDLGISENEIYNGFIFDINEESPYDTKVTRSNLISTGMGYKTKFFK